MTVAKPYLRDFFVDHVQIDPDSPSGLSWRRFGGRQITGKGQDGYYRFQLGGTAWKVHRVIWCLEHGDVDPSVVLDHIDRNKANNSLENLREVTQRQNCLNRTRKLRRFTRFHKNRWEAQFTMPVSRKSVYIGAYNTEQEAHIAAISRRLELYWTV